MRDPVTDAFGPGAIRHHFAGGVYAKETRIPRDGFVVSHAHPYDHMSILASGVATIIIEDQARPLYGPAVVMIKAGQEHRINAISDIVWFCIHATEETDPAKVNDVILQREA